MLKRLRIQNFALIDEVTIEFGGGLNIISGETGAGKSILMNALALVLGGRASSELIRAGADEATVEALFELPEGTGEFAAHGIEPEEGEWIVKRSVNRSGKNRIFVNGNMVTTSTLQKITASLVDLCSQHDQQLLSRPGEQLLWIDRFGSLEAEREQLLSLYRAWQEKTAALLALSTDSALRAQRLDFLRFQIGELEAAELNSPGEDQEIERELKTLGNAEALFAFSAEAEESMLGSDRVEGSSAIVDSLSALLAKARLLLPCDLRLSEAADQLTALKLQAEELGHFIRTYSQSLSRDESRMEDLNARAALLGQLKRKYGPSLAAVIANLEVFRSELMQLENHDSSLAQAKAELEAALHSLFTAATALSAAREKAAKSFSLLVVEELADLHMDRARFQASLQRLEAPNAAGIDAARFEIAANPGEPLGPLTKVASGGELSRIMLAMHNVVSTRGDVGVYLFDEVDAGIGGGTAVKVGTKLRRLAKNNQIICVTHLPQVAAFGETHFHVEKQVSGKGKAERTVTQVRRLAGEERAFEIARMLGGLGNDRAALENARALLQNAASGVKILSTQAAPKSPALVKGKEQKMKEERAKQRSAKEKR